MLDGTGDPFYSPFALSAWPPDTSRPEFPRYDTCPPLFDCVGHADPSSLDTHDTHFERFGPSGVVVSLIGERPALVCTQNARTLWTPEHALLYAAEITSAARFAQQYAWATAMSGVGALRSASG